MPKTRPAHRPRILVVDDDPIIRGVVRAVLDSTTYDLVEAESGTDALERAAERAPDVVLLDIMMPGMSGYDVCRAMRRDPRYEDTVVVMLTALDRPEAREEGFTSGANSYITKPFSPLELLSTVTEAVGHA